MDVTKICEAYQEDVRSYLTYKCPKHSKEDIDIMAHGITHMFINTLNSMADDLRVALAVVKED